MRLRTGTCAALASVLLATGCATPASQRTEVVVYAAASLNSVFTRLGTEFEASHPGLSVKFSFDGSATLLDQLSAGAPADVLATADEPTMAKAVTAHLIGGAPTVFATNVLTMIVPAGNPAGITGLDRSLEGRKLVVCADGVPCGSATRKLAGLLGVTLHPVSEETKVTDVRAKVETGQADAGIVYVTDARASGDAVESIPIAHADQARNDYLIAVPTSATQPVAAAQFIEFVTGSSGRTALADAGFGG